MICGHCEHGSYVLSNEGIVTMCKLRNREVDNYEICMDFEQCEYEELNFTKPEA